MAFSSVILYFGMQDKKDNIDNGILLEKSKLELLYTKRVFELQNKYNKKLEELINNNEKVIKAFADRDRQKLDKLVQPYFDSLISENPNFELICFGLPDMTSFYRAHMQKKFGDDISKVQGVRTVNSLKKRISGFMVSKLGLYYRVTFPVHYQGRYIGLIAFGVNLNYVNDFIHKKLGTESAIIVKTKNLKKSKWYDMLEEGEIGTYTIISSTGELISKLPKDLNLDEKNLRIKLNDKEYSVINDINIKDIKGKDVAKVVLFQDITNAVSIYKKYLYTFVIVLTLLVLVMGFVLLKTFNKFLSIIISINDDLKELNTNLEQRVEEEVIKNREKEKEIFEQSKRAQIGEMIANIAHQWRQPLSAISTISSSMKLKKDLNVLDDEDFARDIDKITQTTQFLSETIDTFRNYLKDDKEMARFILQEHVDKTLNIVDATLANNHINLIKKYTKEQIEMNSISGEVTQVILNIINNAKDILLEREIKDKEITVEILRKNDFALITIEDNAGGIPQDILPKIFDPYFTTKHQAQGTGIGLYMCNTIVTESLKGKIYANNTSNGAKFFIELPCDIFN